MFLLLYKVVGLVHGLSVKVILIGIVSMLMMALFVPMMASGTGDSVEKPQWTEGKKWAIGDKRDLGEMYEPFADDILYNLQGYETDNYNNVTIENIDFDGYISMYVLFVVTNISGNTVTLDVTTLMNISMAGSFSASADAPVAGSYVNYYEYGYYIPHNNTHAALDSAPTERVALAGEVKGSLASIGVSQLTLDKDTLAILSANMDVKMYWDFMLNASNLIKTDYYNPPMGYFDWNTYQLYHDAVWNDSTYQTDYSNPWDFNPVTGLLSPEIDQLVNVTYEDLDLTTHGYANVTSEWIWDAPLDIMDYPYNEGESWDLGMSGGNVSGTVEGMAYGNYSDDEAMDHFIEQYEDMGVTGFPVNLAKIWSPDDEQTLSNGTIAKQEFDGDNITLICPRTQQLQDPVHGSIGTDVLSIYYAGDGSTSQGCLYYWPEGGEFVGADFVIPVTGQYDNPSDAMRFYGLAMNLRSVPWEKGQVMLGTIQSEIEKGYPAGWQFEVVEVDEDGVQEEIAQGDTVSVVVDGNSYEMTVDSASPDTATVSIGNESMTLSTGDKKNVDLDGDGENDIQMEMVEGKNGSATLLLTPTSQSTSDTGTDYLMLGVGVAAGAVIAALAVFLVMRKKKPT
jgi:hypothetical protein